MIAKIVCGVFIAIGVGVILVAHPHWIRADASFSDPMSFELEAYRYLGLHAGIAFILLGLVVGAVISIWPPRKSKTPRSS